MRFWLFIVMDLMRVSLHDQKWRKRLYGVDQLFQQAFFWLVCPFWGLLTIELPGNSVKSDQCSTKRSESTWLTRLRLVQFLRVRMDELLTIQRVLQRISTSTLLFLRLWASWRCVPWDTSSFLCTPSSVWWTCRSDRVIRLWWRHRSICGRGW